MALNVAAGHSWKCLYQVRLLLFLQLWYSTRTMTYGLRFGRHIHGKKANRTCNTRNFIFQRNYEIVKFFITCTPIAPFPQGNIHPLRINATLSPQTVLCAVYPSLLYILLLLLDTSLPSTAHLWALHLVVALDYICISRWRPFRLSRTTLAPCRCRCGRSRGALHSLVSFWLRKAVCHATLLAGELSVAWLTAHSAVVRLSSSRLLMRNNVVCSSAVFAVGRLLVCVVRVWVLKNHVPGVQESRQETKTAQREVYEGVGAAKTFLYPDAYRWELVDVSVLEAAGRSGTAGACYSCGWARTYQDAQKH
jgi:hypothetical protein